jgi:hypothetical protein
MNSYNLLRFIPKHSFTGLIIPKTSFVFSDISSYYNDSREVIYFGKNNISNIERTSNTNDSGIHHNEEIEIRNTIITSNKLVSPLIYEKINIKLSTHKNYSIKLDYELAVLHKINSLNNINISISNYEIDTKNKITPLELYKYYNVNEYLNNLYKYIQSETITQNHK